MTVMPDIEAFFDPATNTISYLVGDPSTRKAAIIDPVLDYDHRAGSVDVRSVEAVLSAARDKGYDIVWTLETHAHADHLSRSPYVKAKTGAQIGIGEPIRDDFVAMRTARDATVSAPTLLLPSIQANIRAGRFPPAHANGVRYLRIPVTFKAGMEVF